MTIHLSIVLFLPLAAGLVGVFLPRGLARFAALAGTVAVLAYVVAMVVDFDSSGGLQWITDDTWISDLGIRYSLGVDGLNLFMIALTAIAWVPCTLVAAFSDVDRPRLYFFSLALAETAVLGAFMAQDLALFIVFFDLMLVPFYFLIGGWGTGDRVRATTKFVIYTLAGSLLMLAAAVALGVLATPDGGELSFALADLRERAVPDGSQNWIVLLFALAFFVKAPLFPLHGWVPDTYRSTSIPVLALLSGVLSKVGVYGFLRIVLPVMPDGAQYWQELFIILAVFSILYGSILAFSQDNIRLVLAYSSIAQLGFIVLGIFAFEEKGAQGALLQMLNHGLVVVALFLIVGAIALRARGSESLRELGGMAFRAPVLAGLFLVVALATLAMPGSGNFVGEILILFGAFEDQLVYGLVASIGVVLAAVYMIRLYQGTMHGRVGPAVESREIDGVNLAAVVPLVAIVIALGVYPHFVVSRSERDTGQSIAKARQAGGQEAAIR
ncbi:MAG TPA: NADH-quinone oxidoreductase subunit M [Thermoleophilaceae bacterium]|nr:NADH-quinone oxidoreductase subunit M [Thermoleophilaceae bacterium]